jgi:transketolase
MGLSTEELLRLEAKANELRRVTARTVFDAGSGHIGGAMCVMDIMTILYYRVMRIKPENPAWEDRDRFVLSKGHAAVGYVSVLADLGYIEKEKLPTFNLTGSTLGMHLDSQKVPGCEASTGSLGHGLPMALGMALAARLLKKDYRVFCVLGDGECDEGAVWEAAMAISHFKATNLVTLIDRNKCMIDGKTEDVMKLEPFAEKWRAFGFEALEIDGHSFEELDEAIEYALAPREKPVAVVCDTVKGCGIDFMEDNHKWHYGAINEEMLKDCLTSLDRHYEKRLSRAKGA